MNKNIEESKILRAQMIAHKQILSFKEALVYLDISESLLYKLTSKKEIDFTKPNGGKIYFKKDSLDQWMLRNESKSKETRQNEVMNYLKSKKNV